jgi:RES domain-containing protein
VTPADTEPAQGLGQFDETRLESPRGSQEEPQPPLPQNISVAGPIYGHDERAKQPHRAVIGPSLVYPSDRNGAVRRVETPLSHAQSILSPRSVHTQPHVVPHGELRHVEACRTM